MIGGTDLFLRFSITTSAGDNIGASSSIVTENLGGSALISVVAPVDMQLINATDNTVGFGATPIKADLTIIHVTF
ncbi:hypothetical protein [Sporomusa sphaeroides]|nr:hypothetical protein [Sporomusa sphaeroides]